MDKLRTQGSLKESTRHSKYLEGFSISSIKLCNCNSLCKIPESFKTRFSFYNYVLYKIVKDQICRKCKIIPRMVRGYSSNTNQICYGLNAIPTGGGSK